MSTSTLLSNITFGIIKPDIASNPVILNYVLNIIQGRGFKIIKIRKTTMPIETCQQFYAQHKEKFFYNRLTTFMSSSPIYALVLMKADAINSWRSLIGKANVYKTIYNDPESLRSKFGLTDTRNGFHGSDSNETVIREASFFFPEFTYLKVCDLTPFHLDNNENQVNFQNDCLNLR